MSHKSPDSFDAHVGNKLRAARLARHISQSDLADGLGISFQQLQKYESGVNRCPLSRLIKIAERFKISVDSFYPDKSTNGSAAARISEIDRYMATTEGVKIANAMVRIADPVVRGKIVQAVEALSEAVCAKETPRFDLAAQVKTLGADSLLPPARKGREQ